MTTSQRWGLATYCVTKADGATNLIHVCGRNRWALERLIGAGPRGCTPIHTPAPRWSGYVHNLRGLGVDIATIHEPHGGPFSGTHARYVLRSPAEYHGEVEARA